MPYARWISIGCAVACAVLHGTLWAGLSAPLPVGTVVRRADVVALAALENVAVESKTAVRVQLRISRAIKGQAAPPTLTATLVLSPQMAARELRYGWFNEPCKQHGYTQVAMAHHLDDQAETFFINLARGS